MKNVTVTGQMLQVKLNQVKRKLYMMARLIDFTIMTLVDSQNIIFKTLCCQQKWILSYSLLTLLILLHMIILYYFIQQWVLWLQQNKQSLMKHTDVAMLFLIEKEVAVKKILRRLVPMLHSPKKAFTNGQAVWILTVYILVCLEH